MCQNDQIAHSFRFAVNCFHKSISKPSNDQSITSWTRTQSSSNCNLSPAKFIFYFNYINYIVNLIHCKRKVQLPVTKNRLQVFKSSSKSNTAEKNQRLKVKSISKCFVIINFVVSLAILAILPNLNQESFEFFCW